MRHCWPQTIISDRVRWWGGGTRALARRVIYIIFFSRYSELRGARTSAKAAGDGAKCSATHVLIRAGPRYVCRSHLLGNRSLIRGERRNDTIIAYCTYGKWNTRVRIISTRITFRIIPLQGLPGHGFKCFLHETISIIVRTRVGYSNDSLFPMCLTHDGK